MHQKKNKKQTKKTQTFYTLTKKMMPERRFTTGAAVTPRGPAADEEPQWPLQDGGGEDLATEREEKGGKKEAELRRISFDCKVDQYFTCKVKLNDSQEETCTESMLLFWRCFKLSGDFNYIPFIKLLHFYDLGGKFLIFFLLI